MPIFTDKSKTKLATCDARLQRVFEEVIKHYDCSVLCGQRGQVEQNEAYATGMSKLKWPNSAHNKMPSLAVDVAPCPINWDNREGFIHFAGFVLGVASQLGIKLRTGLDFNMDRNFKNDSLFDAPHFEVVDEN